MDEKNKGTAGGKRAAPSSGSKAPLIVIGVIAVLLVIGYVVLCAVAGSGKLMPKTTALGVDLAGLTPAQAEAKLSQELPSRLSGKQIRFQEPVSGAQTVLEVDGLVETVELTDDALKDGGFLSRGIAYLQAMMSGGRDVTGEVKMTADGQSRMNAALEEIAHTVGADENETTWVVNDTDVTFTKGVTGRAVDVEQARADFLTTLSAMVKDPSAAGDISVSFTEAPPAEPDMDAIHTQVFTQVADASYDKATGNITEGVVGKDFDVEEARKAVSAAAEGSQVKVPITLTQPKVTGEALRANLFKDVLGAASTKVTGTSVRRNNVRIAASLFNDTVLLPGEEFSYNDICGPYVASQGYGKATAYIGGLSKATLAGGVCQGSSTLYWAILKANIEVTERHPHGYEPSYLPAGLDATVAGGGPNFRFVNSTEYPLKIEAYMDSKNYLHVTLYGTDTTGIHGEPYSANRKITAYAQTIYEPNPAIPAGTTQKDEERTAYNGVSVEAYQKLVDANGNVISTSLLHVDKYKKRDAYIYYNPADAGLWGIDPNTGLKTETPVPTESLLPGESPLPGESGVPVDPNVTPTVDPGVTPTDPSVVPSADPGLLLPPDVTDTPSAPVASEAPVFTPPPAEPSVPLEPVPSVAPAPEVPAA